MADYLDRENEESSLVSMDKFQFGIGTIVGLGDDQSVMVEVDPEPISPGNDSPELREYMQGIVDSWSNQLATIPLGSLGDPELPFNGDVIYIV
jgi:hypothetical protein